MPASICDPVSSALRLSLTAEDSQSSSLLDNRLLSSAKGVLLSKIDFEESGDYQSNVLDGLKSKYVVIRPKKPALESKLLKKDGCSTSSSSESNKNGDQGLPNPKRILFPLEAVHLGWGGRNWSVGAGMQNVGNTCYLNSTLQALFHVPALANWLMSEGAHADKCRQAEGCVICGMRATLVATQKSGGSAIKPWQVYSKLRLICRHLTPGRQEDAHEFLRYLVEAMEKSYLNRFGNTKEFDQFSKETTPLNQILGGYLRSTVHCLSCHHLSTTYQHFQDLLLDIRKHSTLDEALDSFFSRERLEDLGYKCEACNKKVSATKQFFIERAPMVLCIALKRFSLVGGKLSKHIQFRKRIVLNKYMHNKQNHTQLSYRLVGMVTHLGPSQNCGHYTAIGQAPNSNFYQFDDSCVRQIPLSAVLGTNAYIMFFEKENSSPEETVTSQSTASSSSVVYGPQLPDSLNREKSPLKITYYKNEDRKLISFNLNRNATETSKTIEDKPPIILNNTLSKAESNSNGSHEPWVVKENGEIEKVTNGVEKHDTNTPKNNFITKGSKLVFHNQTNGKANLKSDFDMRNLLNQKQEAKPPKAKTPLEKLEEQMSKNDSKRNGSTSKLVPYDSESSGDEKERSREDRLVNKSKEDKWNKPNKNGTQNLLVATKATHQGWTISSEKSMPLLSPSLNGVANNNNVKEKYENPRLEENGKSPNTSTSTMSPASVHSEKGSSRGPDSTRGQDNQLRGHSSTNQDTSSRSQDNSTRSQNGTARGQDNSTRSQNGTVRGQNGTARGQDNGFRGQDGPRPMDTMGQHDTLNRLQHMSHRGYGGPVSTWAGTQSNMGRQVYEERRQERKRAYEGADDMDAGRQKRMKKFNNYNRYNNSMRNNNGYNPFQEKQNKQHWNGNGNFKYHGERRPPHNFQNKQYHKYKRFNRYGNGHHYPRHH